MVRIQEECCSYKIRSSSLAQSCANMVRVSGYLLDRALQKGILVEEITILALLVSHSSPYCIPLCYNACVNGATFIMKGDEILFEEALEMVLMKIS